MYTLPIRSVMKRRQLLVGLPHTTVRKASKLMAGRQVGAILVVQDERLLGIFTERDAVFRVVACGLEPDATPLAAVMTAAPHTVSPRQSFGYAMLVMQQHGFRHLPVVDDGKLVGIVSSRNALDPELEEFNCEERRRDWLLHARVPAP
jgi:CBS domain-containing protein